MTETARSEFITARVTELITRLRASAIADGDDPIAKRCSEALVGDVKARSEMRTLCLCTLINARRA